MPFPSAVTLHRSYPSSLADIIPGQTAPKSQNLTAMAVSTSNGQTNGPINGPINGHLPTVDKTTTNAYEISNKSHTNGTETLHESRISRTESRTFSESSHTHTFTSNQQVTVLRQTVITTRAKLISDLSYVNDHYIDSLTGESFLEFLRHQRMTQVPKLGSRRDKVLSWAEFFALQISAYEKAVSSFVPDSKGAARLIWASCSVLLKVSIGGFFLECGFPANRPQLGTESLGAIETAFEVFYKAGLSLSFFLQHNELLFFNSHIRTEVGQAFNDLLNLVREVTLYYSIQLSAISTEVVLDFNSLFGRHIEAFYGRKDHIIEAMWACKIDGDSVNIHAIRTWLSIRDSTTRKVLRDRAAAKGRRDEYTCQWFERHLLDFSHGNGDVLAVTGPSGCGKSMLWGWIVERLQRVLGKKTHATLSLTIGMFKTFCTCFKFEAPCKSSNYPFIFLPLVEYTLCGHLR
jgi:hypothetical protein